MPTDTKPRSINIREIERAANNIEDAIQHIDRVMLSYASGIQQYQEMQQEPPDEYYIHWTVFEKSKDALQATFEALRDLALEM